MIRSKLAASWFAFMLLVLTACAIEEHMVAPHTAVVVFAQAQTEPVLSLDDAADDPVVWVNPQDPDSSRVIGTDKRYGLEVYDLAGQRLQRIPAGRVNNVDLRPLEGMSGWSSIAAASNRTRNSISLFLVSDSGELSWLESSEILTGLAEPYGLCMYQDASGPQVFVNDKDGRYQQWLLVPAPERDGMPQFAAQLLREFVVPNQPEGCVADDEQGILFLGVEIEGVRTVPADSSLPAMLETLVDIDGDILVADVEGMDLYLAEDGQGYLVVSSQGNFSYAVYDRQAPHRYLGSFVVGHNAELGIDGSQETDGLAVSSLLKTAQFPEGMVVVQDGFNTDPEQAQNFKYISWLQIANALGL